MQAEQALVEELREALQYGFALYGDEGPDGPWPVEKRREFDRLARAALAKANQALAQADQHLSSRAVGDGVESRRQDVESLTAEVWQAMLDKDDRTSPEEYPEMVLITRDELRAAVTLGQALSDRPSDLVGGEELIDYLFDHTGKSNGTPRIVDLCFTAFMRAKGQNDEDGGPTDWMTDTLPNIKSGIDHMKARLLASARSGTRGQASVPDPKTAAGGGE